MELEKAKEISRLALQIEGCEGVLQKLGTGCKDEWVLKNEHTGIEVELTLEQYETFVKSVKEKKSKLEKELSTF